MSAISASPVEPALLPFGSLEWFKRELAPTPARARRTAIMVAAAVLCVIISMTLQVPELSVTAYMPFFMSKESKFLTTLTGVIVVLTLLFLPDAPGPPAHLPKPKSFFVSDAFTNPAHVHFALKVTFAAMFCYIFYMAIDWSGIHTALITCTFIALESTGATL